MIGKSPDQSQHHLFDPYLEGFIDMPHELVLLAEKVNWKYFEDMAFFHFNKNLGEDFYVTEETSGRGRRWNFIRNPLNRDGAGLRGTYVDYHDPLHLQQLQKRISLHPRWFDYFGWFTFPGAGIIGLYNYNSMK